jgi:predicted CoA-binding protein
MNVNNFKKEGQLKDRVVVLGASNDPNRYSYQCVKLLLAHSFDVIVVHPKEKEILGLTVLPNLKAIEEKPHTLTMYVNSQISDQLTQDILRLSPQRVIFNPGSENNSLESILQKNGIKTEEACSLVLLRTGQF